MLRNDLFPDKKEDGQRCTICGKIGHDATQIHFKEQFIVLLHIPLYAVGIPFSVILLLSPFFYASYTITEGAIWTSFFLITYLASLLSSAIVFYMEVERLHRSPFGTAQSICSFVIAVIVLSIPAFFFFWPKLLLSSFQIALRQYHHEKWQDRLLPGSYHKKV